MLTIAEQILFTIKNCNNNNSNNSSNSNNSNVLTTYLPLRAYVLYGWSLTVVDISHFYISLSNIRTV